MMHTHGHLAFVLVRTMVPWGPGERVVHPEGHCSAPVLGIVQE